MKKQRHYLTAGALLCTSALGAFSPMLSASAFDNSVDGSSYFDINAQQCVVDGYNTENGTSITSIEQIDPAKITTLDCSNRNISNFRGVTILTNLKTLNLAGNTSLALGENFLVPDSLKTLNISGVNNSDYLDISNNTNLETLIAGQYLTLKTSTYVEKLSDESEYAYGMKLEGLKFLGSNTPIIDETNYPAKYDSNTKTITYKNKIPYAVSVKVGNSTYSIQSRGGTMDSFLYFEDNEPLEIRNKCEEAEGYDGETYIWCSNAVYYGDTIDTEAFIKKFNLSDYAVSKIEIVPPKANIKLDTDEETVKKGIALADANFTVKYYLDPSDLATPNTGVFTTEGATIVATTATLGIILTSLGLYVSQYVSRRQKSKIRFEKK